MKILVDILIAIGIASAFGCLVTIIMMIEFFKERKEYHNKKLRQIFKRSPAEKNYEAVERLVVKFIKDITQISVDTVKRRM